jgi:hypothetical protein
VLREFGGRGRGRGQPYLIFFSETILTDSVLLCLLPTIEGRGKNAGNIL